jgi:hypothetical protein
VPAPIVFQRPRPHRAVLLGLVVLSGLLVSVALSPPALAKQKPCYEQVIGDWFDDGRVNKIYPLPCYPEAIKNLPPDLLIYGNAEDEIGRAWAYAKQGKPDPGGEGPTSAETGTTGSGTSKTGTDTAATDITETDTTATDTSGPSSVPIPLLVLGGLAVILLAAGSAGYLRRRMNGDADDDGSATPPPVA